MSEGRCACAGKRELEETDVDGRLWHAGWRSAKAEEAVPHFRL